MTKSREEFGSVFCASAIAVDLCGTECVTVSHCGGEPREETWGVVFQRTGSTSLKNRLYGRPGTMRHIKSKSNSTWRSRCKASGGRSSKVLSDLLDPALSARSAIKSGHAWRSRKSELKGMCVRTFVTGDTPKTLATTSTKHLDNLLALPPLINQVAHPQGAI